MDARGKDCNPRKTIDRIKNILNELGLEAEEQAIDSGVGVYSVHLVLRCDGAVIGFCNGKGMTPEYAMASAYAESMERLSAFQMSHMYKYAKFPATSLSKFDTVLYPDEKDMSIEEFQKQNDKLTKHVLSFFTSANNLNMALALLNPRDIPHIKTIPYKNVTSDDKEVVYLPAGLIQHIQGSHGLCAGNNYDEAVCQGIFELMERYCQQEIYRRKITPPDIPDEYLQQMPEVWEAIKNMRSIPNKELIIKDCSLGEGYPVVASLLIDRSEHSYLVNFGSSLKKNIAIERVITELMQGYTVKNYKRMYYVPSLNFNINENINNSFFDGVAEYPVEFFGKLFSYEFKDNMFISTNDNKEMYNYLLKFFKEKGYSLYIRDHSFLGFNCYGVIVPEIMPNIIVFNDSNTQLQIFNDNLCRCHMRIDTMTYDDIRNYIDGVEYALKTYGYLPLLNKFTKYYAFEKSKLDKFEDIRMLLALLYDILGIYNEAYLYADDFINSNIQSLSEDLKEDLSFTRDYFNIKARGITKSADIRKYLSNFYNNSFIDKFEEIVLSQKGLIQYFYGKSCGVNNELIEAFTKYFDRAREVMKQNWQRNIKDFLCS